MLAFTVIAAPIAYLAGRVERQRGIVSDFSVVGIKVAYDDEGILWGNVIRLDSSKRSPSHDWQHSVTEVCLQAEMYNEDRIRDLRKLPKLIRIYIEGVDADETVNQAMVDFPDVEIVDLNEVIANSWK